MAEQLLGLSASVVSFIIFIPQAIVVFRNRRNSEALRGASIMTNVFLIINAILWAAYGFVTHAFWVAAPGAINLPLAAVSIFLIARSRRNEYEPQPALE